MPPSLTIKQLHAKTGEWVRQAGASRSPFIITDRGVPVAVLGRAAVLKPKARKTTLLPEYAALLARGAKGSVLEDLDDVRGTR